jgi:putative transcriptional regulator
MGRDRARHPEHEAEEKGRALINVRAIRLSLNLTQEQFAERFRLSVATLRQWEQGRCKPDNAAAVLLTVIAHAPKAVDEALKAAS